MIRHLVLYAYGTREALRELNVDEQAVYQAMLDTFTPAEKEHGVVEGRIFGYDGLVYAEDPGLSQSVTVELMLERPTARKLRALAQARGLDIDTLIAHWVEDQPAPYLLSPRLTITPEV